MSEWISVKNRLPEKDTKVLIYYHSYMDVMEYWHDTEEGKPKFYGPPNPPIDYVSYWMPLPQPPKNED